MDRLIETLAHDNDPTQRRQAVAELARLRIGLAVEALIHALDDDDLEVRRLSALALGAIGEKRAIPALKVAFEANSKVDVFLAISIALSELGETDTLSSALGSESGWPRKSTVQALLRYEDGRAVNCLINAL